MSPRPRLDHVRRPAILAAAAEVIRERGLENTRVADVAERAGTSAPSVLYWFASKSELLTVALTAAEENFYQALHASLAELDTARERIVRLIESASGSGDYDATLWIDLWARALRDEELARIREQLDERWRETIAQIVRDGQESGEFGPTDADELALLLGAVLDGLSVQIALGDPAATPGRARELCMRLAERELGCDLSARAVGAGGR
jgi:AcrR family transcriptional regulator